jgi:hypothetical protein
MLTLGKPQQVFSQTLRGKIEEKWSKIFQDDCLKIEGHWYCTMNCSNCKVDRKMMPY